MLDTASWHVPRLAAHPGSVDYFTVHFFVEGYAGSEGGGVRLWVSWGLGGLRSNHPTCIFHIV
jgi:hypothetical protein